MPWDELIDCPDCEGTGFQWDETACGDPDHCAQTYTCYTCEGTGLRRVG